MLLGLPSHRRSGEYAQLARILSKTNVTKVHSNITAVVFHFNFFIPSLVPVLKKEKKTKLLGVIPVSLVSICISSKGL